MDPSSLFKPFSPTPALLDAMHCNLCTEPFGVSPAPASVTRRAFVSTACGHTFCDQCVASLKDNNYKKCSICNGTVDFQSGFQRNFRLEEQQAATATFLATIQENVRMFLDEPSMVEAIAAGAKQIKEQSQKAFHTILTYCQDTAANGFYSFDLYPHTYTPMTFKFIKMELNDAGFTLLEKRLMIGELVIAVQWHEANQCEANQGEAAKLKSIADEAKRQRQRASDEKPLPSPDSQQTDVVAPLSFEQKERLERLLQDIFRCVTVHARSGLLNVGYKVVHSDICAYVFRQLTEEGFTHSHKRSSGRTMSINISWKKAIRGKAFECKRLVVMRLVGNYEKDTNMTINRQADGLYVQLVSKAWELIQKEPAATAVAINVAGIDPEVENVLGRKCLYFGGFFTCRAMNPDLSDPQKPYQKFEIGWKFASRDAGKLLKDTGLQLLAARQSEQVAAREGEEVYVI